jgi:beta-glucanase (GH16 family)
VSERKSLDPLSSDRVKASAVPTHERAGNFLRSIARLLDTSQGVKVRPQIRRLARALLRKSRALGALAVASAIGGCGSKEDLIIGVDDYTLERRVDFNSSVLDDDYWELATHTFEPNLAWFSPNNAKIESGLLVLSITADAAPTNPMPNEEPKPYSAAEVRTRDTFLYGRFRTRARLAAGNGVVSAFWGFYDQYSNTSGPKIDNQIVFETGVPEGETAHQLRYSVNVPSAPSGTDIQDAPSDPSAGFHVFGYDWTPTEVRFVFDGQTRLVIEGGAAAELEQYQRLVLSAYPSGAAWLGEFDPKQLPLTAEFDWVEVSSYKGPRP